MKKKLSLILAVIMVLSMIPLGALNVFAADDFENGQVIKTYEIYKTVVKQQQKTDPSSGEPMVDDDGNPVMENVQQQKQDSNGDPMYDDDGNPIMEDVKETVLSHIYYGFYYDSDEAAVNAGCVARIENGNGATPIYVLSLRVASAFAVTKSTVYLLQDIADTGAVVYYTVRNDDGYTDDDQYIGTEQEKMSQETSALFDCGSRYFTLDGQGYTLSCTSSGNNLTFQPKGRVSGMVFRNLKITACTQGLMIGLQVGKLANDVAYTFDNVTVTSDLASPYGVVLVQPGTKATFNDCTIISNTSQEVYNAYKAANGAGDSVTAGIRLHDDTGSTNQSAVVNITGNTTVTSAFGSGILIKTKWTETNKQRHTVTVNTTGTITGGVGRAAITSGAYESTVNIYAGNIHSGSDNGNCLYLVNGNLNVLGGNFYAENGGGINTTNEQVNIADATVNVSGTALTFSNSTATVVKGTYTSVSGKALYATKGTKLDVLNGTFTVNDAAPASTDTQETINSRGNFALLANAKATVNVYDGDFTTNYTTTVRVSDAGTTLNLYGGTYTSNYGVKNHSTVCATNGVTNIYDGSYSNGQFGVIWPYGEATMNIYNGEFFFNDNYSSLTSPLNVAVVIMGRTTTQTVLNVYSGRYTQAEGANAPCLLNNTGSQEHDCVIYGGYFRNGSAPFTGMAYASGETSFDLAPMMNDGAQVRLVPDTNGLRFTSEISKTVLDYIASLGGTVTSYGTIIAPFEYLQYADDFTQTALDRATIPGVPTTAGRYVDIIATSVDEGGGMKINDDESVSLSAALVKIKSENLDREFAARSYLVYTIGEGDSMLTMTLYSNFDSAENVRTIQFVAQKALADVAETADETYVTEVSSYLETEDGVTFTEVAGTAYSRYTEEELTVLRAYLPKKEVIA